MPSSSSAKKVARVAARSGAGPTSGAKAAKQRNWLFAVAIVAIVALGLGAVVFARDLNQDRTANTTAPRAQVAPGQPFDHWHSAFAINVCGKELPATPEPPTDDLGIHTHGDGLVHIHPFVVSAAGKRATMARYWNLIGLKVTNDGFQLPKSMPPIKGDERTVEAGSTTCAGKPSEVVMAYWKDGATAAGSKPDKVYTSDFSSVRFTKDLSAYTLALVPKGDRDIAAPSSSAEVVTLGACDGPNPPPSCSPGAGAALPPGAEGGASGSGSSPSGDQQPATPTPGQGE